jgi:hypothetical protein
MAATSAKDIKTAVEMLDPKDDAHWEKDGSPKMSQLKQLTGNPKLTSDDVDEAVGAFKRPGGDTIGGSAPEAEPEVVVAAPAAPVEPARDRPRQAADPRDPLDARVIVEESLEALSDLRAEIDETEKARNELQEKLNELNLRKSENQRRIETYSPRITQAESVKAIQRQTIERLAAQKAAQISSAAALAAAGVHQSYPSKLDASLANRKRSPAETANYAKFVHQNAASKNTGV